MVVHVIVKTTKIPESLTMWSRHLEYCDSVLGKDHTPLDDKVEPVNHRVDPGGEELPADKIAVRAHMVAVPVVVVDGRGGEESSREVSIIHSQSDQLETQQ